MSGSSEGLYRFSGMYGYVIMDGAVRAEITGVTATITIAKIEIPIVGSTKMGIKPGRETREGTFTVQKIDGYWENYVYGFLNQNLQQRRDNRGTAAGVQRSFTMQVWLDDPDALGREIWSLQGCLVWDLALGFAITDDSIEKSFTFGWETEVPLESFEIVPNGINPVTQQPLISMLETLTP